MRFSKAEVVELIYMNANGELSQRQVRIIAQKGDRVLAYCYTRRRMRSFNLDNILGIRKVKAA